MNRVGRKARLPLFAVRNDWRSRILEAPDRLAYGVVKQCLERVGRDASGTVVPDALDELSGSWDTSDGFGGQRHGSNLGSPARRDKRRFAFATALAGH